MGMISFKNERQADIFFDAFVTTTGEFVVVHGNMKRKSTKEFWHWLVSLVKKINGLLQYFKCEGVSIIDALYPMQRGFKYLEQRHIMTHCKLERKLDAKVSLKGEVSTLDSLEKSASRVGKVRVKCLVIGKRRIEFEEPRCLQLTQKRRKIARCWMKQWETYESRQCSSATHERLKENIDNNSRNEGRVVDCPYAKRKYNDTFPQKLPDEIVDKVLACLPLSIALRCRSVCRQWHTMLSPEAWREDRRPRVWGACVALFTCGNGHRECAVHDMATCKWSLVFLDFLPGSACQLLTSNGGLLCLCHSGMNSSLVICNPLTRSWRQLPVFNHTRHRPGSMLVHMLVHPKTDAYKVILVSHGRSCMTSTPSTMIEVFNSEIGSWTTLANVPSDGSSLASSIILRKGILYCLTELPPGLLAFNLARKVWRRLEIKSHFRVLSIFEHHGHILLVGRITGRITRLGIWKLKESFPRVWLKVTIMPGDHANIFIKGGRFQCFGHGNFICFASPRRQLWLLLDLSNMHWTWGTPAQGLNEDNYNRWFFFEPRLGIQA